MKYVLGAGIAGLVWAFYHPDYKIVTDKLAWAVVGVVPKIVLYDNEVTKRWVWDVMGEKPAARPLAIGYLLEDGSVHPESEITPRHGAIIMDKKMRPWGTIRRAGYDPAIVGAKVGQRSAAVIDVDAHSMVYAMTDEIVKRGQIIAGSRVIMINDGAFGTSDGRVWPFEHIVSTIPAPIFQRLWCGGGLDWDLRSISLTMVMSDHQPEWLTDEWHFIYDAREASPVSRVTRIGSRPQYEITGHLPTYDADVFALRPSYVFPYPHGRLVGGGPVQSPLGSIRFLGRFAQWDYRILTDTILEVVLMEEANA